MKETLSKRIYSISLTVMGFSLLLMPFVSGMAPFNLSLGWSEEGVGSALVLMQENAAVDAGGKVAGSAGTIGEVQMYSVQDSFRKDGSFYYQVTGTAGGNETTSVMAGRYGQQVLLSIPFLGAWVRMLIHPVGALLLVGLPMMMFLLNLLAPFVRRLLPVLSSLEERAVQARNVAKRRKESKKVETEAVDVDEKESKVESEYITVLKPFNRHNYSV